MLTTGARGRSAVCLSLSVGNHNPLDGGVVAFVQALGGTLALGATFVVVPIVQIIKSVPLRRRAGIWRGGLRDALPSFTKKPRTMGVALSVAYQPTHLASLRRLAA